MIYSEKLFRDKINQLLDKKCFEDACFLIIEGLSLLDESNISQMDYDDNEVIGIMENM